MAYIKQGSVRQILKAAAPPPWQFLANHVTFIRRLREIFLLIDSNIYSNLFLFFNDMKFFTIIVFKLQICFKCVSFSSLYSTSTKKRQGDCQNFSRRILASFNQRPQIMEFLLSWIYLTLNILNSWTPNWEVQRLLS